MEDTNREKVILTVVLTFAEGIVGYILYKNNILNTESFWILFLSYVTPMGFLCFLNYWILSPVLIRIGLSIWCWLGHYRRISKQFNSIAIQCVTWLKNVKMHWGVIDTAEECQNANTCEGLLAMKKTKLDQRYKVVYEEALIAILNKVTDRGLASKSLKHETVVCTSMILYIFSLERKTNRKMLAFEEKFNDIASILWDVRCNNGWGVYIERTDEADCSIANTFWAFRALNEYTISKSEDYRIMLRRIYENSSNSLFGYIAGDVPRLCTTAMSIVIYYGLEEQSQSMIREVYNVKIAVEYVYRMFCYKGLECELEVLRGLETKSQGVKKAPWTHVTIEFVTEALVSAYKNGDLNLIKMNYFIRCLKKVCEKRLVYVNGNNQQCYYMPKDMEINSKGIYTFPTAYMAWALSMFDF